MPRKRKRTATNETGKRKQFNVSFEPGYAAKLDATADSLGLDVVGLIRMIVKEHFAEYEKRAKAVRDAEATS